MDNLLSKFVFDKVGIPTYRKFLDLTAFRHKLISGNMANISTPGYKARDIDFKAEFEKMTDQSNHLQGKTTNTGHIQLGARKTGSSKVHEQRVPRGDMNSVDIDREVSNMAQNELLYTIGARLLQKKFDALRKAINSK